jgi:hypothetical protein
MFAMMFDLSGFSGLMTSAKLKYETQWNTYNRIQIVNSNVSTLRASGDKTALYYQFPTYEEKTAFTNGQMLHIKRYPDSNWAPIPQD